MNGQIADIAGEENVQIIKDIVFGKGGNRDLLMDAICLKEKTSESLPAIIWIHGGAWMAHQLDKSYRPEQEIIHMVKKGYFCVSIDYRLSDEAIFPAQIEDCKCAVRFLRANAKKYNIDIDRIGVWGESAGGHLAALLGTTGNVEELEGTGGWNEYSSNVQAVCEWYAPIDLVTLGEQKTSLSDSNRQTSPEELLIGGTISQNIEKARKASPNYYINKDVAEFLIMHGDIDNLVPITQSEQFYQELKNAGATAQFHVVREQGHGFFKGEENYKLIYDFFDRCL